MPGRPAGQRERAVPGELEAAQEQLADEVADVQRVGGGVEADVDPDVALGEARRERVAVGGVVDQSTGVEVGEQVHTAIHTSPMLPAHPVETAGIQGTTHRRGMSTALVMPIRW